MIIEVKKGNKRKGLKLQTFPDTPMSSPCSVCYFYNNGCSSTKEKPCSVKGGRVHFKPLHEIHTSK